MLMYSGFLVLKKCSLEVKFLFISGPSKPFIRNLHDLSSSWLHNSLVCLGLRPPWDWPGPTGGPSTILSDPWGPGPHAEPSGGEILMMEEWGGGRGWGREFVS